MDDDFRIGQPAGYGETSAAGGVPCGIFHAVTERLDAMENRGVAAVLANDVGAPDKIWSDELLVNAPNNRVARKSEILSMLRQQTGLQYGTFARHREATLVKPAFVVTFASELVTGKGNDGKAVTRRYTNVWHREGSQWRLVARQDSNVAEPDPGR